MKGADQNRPRIVICCGGSGGHFFPGWAVAEELARLGCEPELWVSSRPIDQRLLASVPQVYLVHKVPLRHSCLDSRSRWHRLWNEGKEWSLAFWDAWKNIRQSPPAAIFSTGGFTGVPIGLLGGRKKIPVYLFEANAVLGRANRLLARFARRVWVFFPTAGAGLKRIKVKPIGMPIRFVFSEVKPEIARREFNLDPQCPTLLVISGSGGAGFINQKMVQALPSLRRQQGHLQVIHFTGQNVPSEQRKQIRKAYRTHGIPAYVKDFDPRMDLALQAADLVISRAGASSLAEIAATGVPPILIPLSGTAHDHQLANARAFADSGAARMIRQEEATPERLVQEIHRLFGNPHERETMRQALRRWYRPDAARMIAQQIVVEIAG